MSNFQNVFYLHATLTPPGIIFDIGGKIIEDLGINEKDFLGKNFSQISFWEHSEVVSQNIHNSLNLARTGENLELETTLKYESAKLSTIKANFTPVFNEQKQVEKIFFSAVDVSEYIKEINFHKIRNERFLFAAESAEVGLWFWQTENEEIFTTPFCNKLYGLMPNEVMTFQRFIEKIYREDVAVVEEAFNNSQTNLGDYNVKYRIRLESDSMRWLSVHGKTFSEEGNSMVMMGSVRDITHQKLSDERLQKLYEIEKNAKAEVEEANLQKDHFLAIVSHELRSPLQTILGWAKILLSNEIDKETRQKALETIENSAKLQAKLISDLVDSSKVISGKLDFSVETLNLSKLVDSVYQSQKPLANEKNINFVLENIDGLEINGDSVRLQQAITNLVSNAIKFTPLGGTVLIQLNEKANQAALSITDSGPGIPNEDLPFIFKQYFQAKSSENKTGLGLGLSIAKAIINKLGGEISAKNNVGGIGCTFSVILPINQNKETDVSESPIEIDESIFPLKNIKILIVEDNLDSREVLDFYLSRLGAKIQAAASAQEGLSYLTSTDSLPNVIISDISMPEEDGYSFIKKVRNLSGENKIPAIALTAFASSNDEKRVIEAGFQKYHTKPFEPDLLVSDILELASIKK